MSNEKTADYSDIKIMAVDDEEILLLNIKEYFSDYNLTIFTNPTDALKELGAVKYDIIITDYKMPKMNGIEFLSVAKKMNAFTYSILMTAYAEKEVLETAINENLVNKVAEKPMLLRDLKVIVENAIEECRNAEKNEIDIKKITSNYYNFKNEFETSKGRIIGFNRGLHDIYQKVQSIAKHNVTVLLNGETGTGKEVIARAIHEMSPRRDYPFVKINATAIPESLFESELFGYKKGAFSNAVTDKAGKFELADKGTLFLDEIGDMPLSLQAKLLRVIQEKEVERLGSNQTIKVDFRLIVATNKELPECIKEGQFREDLYYRINEFPITMPPLRDRVDDIEDLVRYFIKKFSDELNIQELRISQEAIDRLKGYSWPGNVRELENAVKRVVIVTAEQREILASHFYFIFPDMVREHQTVDTAIKTLRDEVLSGNIELGDIEEMTIKAILDYYHGNVGDAVAKTGISKNKFYKYK